jgi:hypothetical protein
MKFFRNFFKQQSVDSIIEDFTRMQGDLKDLIDRKHDENVGKLNEINRLQVEINMGDREIDRARKIGTKLNDIVGG